MKDRQTQRAVKNILHNELGITSEKVETLITEYIDKRFDDKMNILTEEFFEKQYKLQINHFQRAKNHVSIADEDICSFGGKSYETYGEELDYIIEMSKQNRVLTIIEGDEDDIDNDGEPTAVWYITSGFHHVNRIGYLVTKQPLNGEEFQVKLEY